MLKKFTAFQVESAVLVPKNAGPARLSRIRRAAHRHHFDYEPRRGFLYVRSRAISSRTNDNYDEFPAEEIKQAYRTFIGKPVFVNHVNDNHHRARGVIIDAALHEDTLSDGSPDTWAEVLMEVDAIRFPKLAEAILAGRIDRTSMGCDVAYSICSMCGNKATTPAEYCQHIPRLKGKKVLKRNAATGSQEEHLIRETCYGLKFFENSLLVEEPADPTAFFTGVDSTGLGKAASKTAAEETHGPLAWPPHPDDYDDPQWSLDRGGLGDEGLAGSRMLDQHHRPVGDWSRWESHGEEPEECGICGAHTCFVGNHFGHATQMTPDEVHQWIKERGHEAKTAVTFDQCGNCGQPIRETGDYVAPWVHEHSGNSFCDVDVPEDAVWFRGTEGRPEAHPTRHEAAHWTDGRDDLSEEEKARYRAASERQEQARAKAEEFRAQGLCDCPGSLKIEPHPSGEHSSWAQRNYADGKTDAWGHPLHQPYDGHGAWNCNNFNCVEHPQAMYEQGVGMPGWMQHDLATSPEEKDVRREVGKAFHEQGMTEDARYLLDQQDQGPTKYSSLAKTAEWYYNRSQVSGEPIIHNAGHPLPSGRQGLDVGDHVLFDSGHSAKIKAITRNLLLLEGHPTPMHRGPIEGDHSKSIWSSDTIDEAGQDVPGMTEEQRRFLDSNSGGPTKYSSLDPNEIARAVDKASDDLGRQHMDDLTFVPHWEPLRKAVPESELGGWMFMGRHSHPDDHVANEAWDPDLGTPLPKDFGRTDRPRRDAPGELVDYKHGITRARLTLDQNGHAWKVVHQPGSNGLGQGRALSGPYSPGRLLKQHYQDLESFGHTPETPYDDDFIAERNQRLKDAGYSVVEGRTPHQGSLVQHFAASYPGSPEYQEGDRVWSPVSGHEGHVTEVHPSHVPYTSHEVSVRWDHGGHERLPEQHIDHSPNAPAEQQERAGHSYRALEDANRALEGLGDAGWLFAQQPTGPTRQSSRKTASTACPDCGGEEYYPGEHTDHPALHGKTRTSQDSVHLWQDQHGLTNVPMKWRSPSEHSLWDHFHTEELAWHPENPSNATEDWETDPGPEDHLVDDFTPLRQSLNLSQHFAVSWETWERRGWDAPDLERDRRYRSGNQGEPYPKSHLDCQHDHQTNDGLREGYMRCTDCGAIGPDLDDDDEDAQRLLDEAFPDEDHNRDGVWLLDQNQTCPRCGGGISNPLEHVTNPERCGKPWNREAALTQHFAEHDDDDWDEDEPHDDDSFISYMPHGVEAQALGKPLTRYNPETGRQTGDLGSTDDAMHRILHAHHDAGEDAPIWMWGEHGPSYRALGDEVTNHITKHLPNYMGSGPAHQGKALPEHPPIDEYTDAEVIRNHLVTHHDQDPRKLTMWRSFAPGEKGHSGKPDITDLIDQGVGQGIPHAEIQPTKHESREVPMDREALLEHHRDLHEETCPHGDEGCSYPNTHTHAERDTSALLDSSIFGDEGKRDWAGFMLDDNKHGPTKFSLLQHFAGTSPDDNPMNHIFRGNPGQEDCHCGWGEDMHPHLTAGPGVRCTTCGHDYKHHPLHDPGRYHFLREQAARPPVDPKAQMESLFNEFGRDYAEEGVRDLIDGAYRNPRSAEEWLNKGTQGPTKYSLLQHFSSHPDYPSGVPFECPECGDYRTQDHCDTCYDRMLYGKKPNLLRRWMRGASLSQHFASEGWDEDLPTEPIPGKSISMADCEKQGHGPWNAHDQCLNCGYTYESEAERTPCTHPWCLENEAPHSEAEHMDPDPEQVDRTDHFHHVHGQDVRCSDLDHCPSLCDHTSENCDVHAIETGRLIDSAFGDQAKDGKWLLDQQPTGPTKYSLLQALADNSYRMRDHGDPSEMRPRLRDQQSYREHLMQDHGYSKADLDRLQDRQWRKARDGEVEVPSGRDNLRGVVEFLEGPMKAEHDHLHAGDPTRFKADDHTHPMLDRLAEPDLHDEKRRADPARGGFVDPQNPNVSPYKRLDGTHPAMPNLQKGHDPHDPSTWTNLSACQQTYPISDDERGDYMDAAHRAQDAWRDGKISRETFEGLGHMCHECGAFKYLHAQPYSFDPDRLRHTTPVTPLRQSLNSGAVEVPRDRYCTDFCHGEHVADMQAGFPAGSPEENASADLLGKCRYCGSPIPGSTIDQVKQVYDEAFGDQHALRYLRGNPTGPTKQSKVASGFGEGDADAWKTCDQGHRHWGTEGAAGLLIRHRSDDGSVRYLLQHRAPWVDDGDTWGIPAGALHKGEHPLEGAKREAVEELGNIPHGLRHVDTHTDDHGGWAFHTLIMESPSMWGSSGGEDADHEVGEGGTGWYTPEQMKGMKLHPGFAKNWDRLQEMAKTSKRVGQRGVWPVRVKIKDRATGRYTGTYVGNQNSERGSWPFRVCENHFKQLQGDIARHNLEASDHPHLYEAEHDTWPLDPTDTENISNCDACTIGSVNKAFAAKHPKRHRTRHHHHRHPQNHPMYSGGLWLGGWGHLHGGFPGLGYCCDQPGCVGDDAGTVDSSGAVGADTGADGGTVATRRTANHPDFFDPGHYGPKDLQSRPHPDRMSDDELHHHLSVEHGYGDDGVAYNLEMTEPGRRGMDSLHNWSHQVSNYGLDPNHSGKPMEADDVPHTHGEGWRPGNSNSFGVDWQSGDLRHMDTGNTGHVVETRHCPDCGEPLAPDAVGHIHLSPEVQAELQAASEAGQMRREMDRHNRQRVVNLADPHDLRAHMMEAHDYRDDDFWRNSHAEDHPALDHVGPDDDDDRPLSHREIRRLHDWEHGHGIVNEDPDYHGGEPGHFLGDEHFHTASLRKKADEDQCPYDASDSLMEGGVYTCENGHRWRPSDPAARAYHEGPGVLQPLPKKATWIGDHFDEPTLFWRAPKSKQWEVHVHNFTPGRDLREGYGAKPTQDVYLLHADNKSDRMAPGYKGPNPGAWQVKRHPYPSKDNDGIQYTHNAWGGAPGHVPPHVVKQVKRALDTVERHAEDHANIYGGLAEQQDIRDDLDRVPRDMAAEEKAHRMFDRLMEQSRDDDDPHTATRRTAAWNVPGLTEFSDTNDRWSKPKGKAPYDPLKAHHGLEPKQEGHGPWYVTRHPETEAYQVVDAKNRLVQSFKTPGHPAYELHDSNAEHQAIHRAVQANQDHGHMPKWVDRDGNEVEETGVPRWGGNGERIPGAEKARRPGESEEDAFGIDAQHIGFHLPAPPWEHGTEHPRMTKYRQMAEENPPEKIYPPKTVLASSSREHGSTYRQVQHGEPDYDSPGAFHDPSPDEEWHGPYRVIQHPDTGKYHVVDNQNRVTRYGGREGMDDAATAHYMRDYADGRQASKEKAKGLAEGLWNSTMEIVDPGGTDDSRRAERNMRSMDELMHRYEGGDQHPLHPGRFGYDEDEDGDNGEPYYEVTDPGGSGWKARDYGGNTVRIHHAATGDTEHDLYTIGDERENQKPVGFGHDELHQALSHFVNGDPNDSEPYAPGPDYAENDPKIKRWQRRNGYTHG